MLLTIASSCAAGLIILTGQIAVESGPAAAILPMLIFGVIPLTLSAMVVGPTVLLIELATYRFAPVRSVFWLIFAFLVAAILTMPFLALSVQPSSVFAALTPAVLAYGAAAWLVWWWLLPRRSTASVDA
jgi:hypothetical protein